MQHSAHTTSRAGHSCQHQRAFTLIELLIALAALTLLLLVGLPPLGKFTTTQRGVAATNLLVGHIAFTRAAAVTRSSDAVLCPSQNGATCLQGTDWTAGWIAFLDPDGDRAPTMPGDTLLVERRPTGTPIRIQSSAGRRNLRYRADGHSSGTNLTVSICNAHVRLFKVVVNNSGRPRSERSPEGERCAT